MDAILLPHINDARLLPVHRFYEAMGDMIYRVCREEVYYLTIDTNMLPMPSAAEKVLYDLGATDVSTDVADVYHVIFATGTDVDTIEKDLEYILWLHNPVRLPSKIMSCKSYAVDDLHIMSDKIADRVNSLRKRMNPPVPTQTMLDDPLWPIYQKIDGKKWHLFISEGHTYLDVENIQDIRQALTQKVARAPGDVFRTIEAMEIHMHPIRVHI